MAESEYKIILGGTAYVDADSESEAYEAFYERGFAEIGDLVEVYEIIKQEEESPV